ncbi:MAG: PA0069 family radical SAM protein [Spirochaetia bacterium]|nr:PA0069 family radical SAM protein [Spirochaetia bacterium]
MQAIPNRSVWLTVDANGLESAIVKRGSQSNPDARFLSVQRESEPGESISPLTEIIKDSSKSILSRNDSPDVGFSVSLNPYRGCEHGCIYCYARPTHEYLDLSAGQDFESKIFAKYDAASLLRNELSHKRFKPEPIALSGVTDPYQPVERKLMITRDCIDVLRDFRNPTIIITKNHLVTRDIDYFREMAESNLIRVILSITTLDENIRARMEPRTSTIVKRLHALEMLRANGIQTGILMAPVIPGLTDHEIPSILRTASDAGAEFAHYVLLRLPHGVKDLFQEWLSLHFPDRKAKILGHLREAYGEKLYDSQYGVRGKGEGSFADHVRKLFRISKRKYGLDRPLSPLRSDLFTPVQGELFR